ncbi:MAG: LytR/AlgR family response regulator transcription factor [Bryobacteraceae bacterium]
MQERATATLTALIVDDEALARDELSFLLKDFPDIEIAGTASNGLEAVELVLKLEPDIVFLDVQMPGLDGLGVVHQLRERGAHLPYFVFATAFDQYAVEAFRLEALDYLLKPVEKVRLEETIERARRYTQENPPKEIPLESAQRLAPTRTKLMVRKDNRNYIVDSDDLVYATIDNGQITLVTTTVEGLSNYRTIEDLQATLNRETFWRVHRSYLVNVNRIREVVPWFKSSFQIRMDDKRQTEIPVSRVQTKRLRELLHL